MEPTRLLTPFGSRGPKVALFGTDTGDWNMSRFQKEGDHSANLGLYFRLNQVAENCFRRVYVPTLTDCNTVMVRNFEFPTNINRGINTVEVRCGVNADGVTLLRGEVAALATADCPTIIAHSPSMGTTIVAHAGAKSLVDMGLMSKAKKPTRKRLSVVDSVVEEIRGHLMHDVQVFITCGIKVYIWPELSQYLRAEGYTSAAQGGWTDLKQLAAEQFARHGIYNVSVDTIDTVNDHKKTENGMRYLWHSYRRAKTSDEKTGRNLVLVVT